MNAPDTSRRKLRGRVLSPRVLAAFALLGLIVAHLSIGTDPLVLAAAMACMAVGLGPLWLLGPLNFGALLVAVVFLRYVGIVLLAKLLMGQPLQSNLFQPLPSFLVVLTGITGYALAALLATKWAGGKSWLPKTYEASAMRRIAIVAAIIGFTALGIAGKIVNDAAEGQDAAKGAGGAINFLAGFIVLALTAAIASALARSKGRTPLDLLVIVIASVIAALSLVFNNRSSLVGALITFVVSLLAFRGGLRAGLVLTLATGLIIMMVFITPLTLYVRSQIYNATVSQRFAAVVDAVQNWDLVMAAYDEYTAPDPSSRQFYLNYYGRPQNTLERVSQINHVDVVKDAVDRGSSLGWEDLREAFALTLPSFLGVKKDTDSSAGDRIFCRLNVHCFYGGHATVPLIASGYASFGWLGALLYPICLVTPLLLLFNLIAGASLKQNLWAIFFLVESYWGFSEGGTDYYIPEMLRILPQYVIALGFLNILLGIGRIKLFRTSAGQHRIRARLAARDTGGRPL